jgi:hypothetical protein
VVAEALEFFQVLFGECRYPYVPGYTLAGRQLPRYVTEEVPLWKRRRAAGRGDRTERQVKQRGGNLGIDQLVGFHFSVPEIEEGLPADKASRRAEPTAEVVRVIAAFLRWIKDHPKESLVWLLGVVPCQVRSIRGAYQTVAEAINGALELDGDERNIGPVEFPSPGKDVVQHRLANEEWQELVNNHPLVMPRGEPAGSAEHFFRRLWPASFTSDVYAIVGNKVDSSIMK